MADKLEDYKFVHLETGEEFADEFPNPVSVPHGEQRGNIHITLLDTKSKDEEGYFDAVVAYMFMNGFACINKETGELKRYT